LVNTQLYFSTAKGWWVHNFISALPKVGEYTTLFQHCPRLANTQLYFSTAKGWWVRNFVSALPKVGECTTLFQHCQRLVNTQLYFSTAKGWWMFGGKNVEKHFALLRENTEVCLNGVSRRSRVRIPAVAVN
jgi:hypothetical protein